MIQENTKLTIALVTTEYITEANFDGGLANYLHRLALSLKYLGHEPMIIIASHKNEIIIHKNICIYRVNVKWNLLLRILNRLTFKIFNYIIGILLLSWKINQALKKNNKTKKISIIQYPSCGALGLFRLKNTPAITRISGYLPLWNDAYELKKNLDITLMEKLEELAYQQTDALFAPSQLNASIVEKVIGKPVSVIETPFILETDNLDYSIYTETFRNKKYLLFFGTIGVMKGCGLIADIINPLLTQNSDLYFAFIGKDTNYLGYQGIRLVKKIRENAGKNQDRVIHIEPLNHSSLYPIIANSYAVVLPSRVDNFPNTCLEAMAHKKIVIGTQGTSFEQLITDEVNGFLCQKDNPQSLLAIIEKVLNLTEPQRLEIGEKAYQRIQDLKPEKVVNQLVDFYRQVINDFYLKQNNQQNNVR